MKLDQILKKYEPQLKGAFVVLSFLWMILVIYQITFRCAAIRCTAIIGDTCLKSECVSLIDLLRRKELKKPINYTEIEQYLNGSFGGDWHEIIPYN